MCLWREAPSHFEIITGRNHGQAGTPAGSYFRSFLKSGIGIDGLAHKLFAKLQIQDLIQTLRERSSYKWYCNLQPFQALIGSFQTGIKNWQ